MQQFFWYVPIFLYNTMNRLLFLTLTLVTGISVFSCSDTTTNTPAEFIANDASFANFATFSNDANRTGVDPALGAAHAGNDATSSRKIYFKNGQAPVNGKYPVGTVVVKHTTNQAGTINMITAMAKRGNNFNPTKGDWEFFMLNPNGSIMTEGSTVMRGANLMDGMCGGCHNSAVSKDFIFTK